MEIANLCSSRPRYERQLTVATRRASLRCQQGGTCSDGSTCQTVCRFADTHPTTILRHRNSIQAFSERTPFDSQGSEQKYATEGWSIDPVSTEISGHAGSVSMAIKRTGQSPSSVSFTWPCIRAGPSLQQTRGLGKALEAGSGICRRDPRCVGDVPIAVSLGKILHLAEPVLQLAKCHSQGTDAKSGPQNPVSHPVRHGVDA